MTVTFDASFLIPLLDEKAPEAVVGAKRRARQLVDELEKSKDVIVVPTPALSELLVKAEAAGPAWIQILGNSARFRVAAFDTLAAVEAAAMTAQAVKAGNKLGGVQPGANIWQKVKFDRQIIAISRVQGATVIYSHDPDMNWLAEAGDEDE